MTKHYRACVPVQAGQDSGGNDRTRYVRVGVMFENTSSAGEVYHRLLLDFPVGATEILLFPPRPEDGDAGAA